MNINAKKLHLKVRVHDKQYRRVHHAVRTESRLHIAIRTVDEIDEVLIDLRLLDVLHPAWRIGRVARYGKIVVVGQRVDGGVEREDRCNQRPG